MLHELQPVLVVEAHGHDGCAQHLRRVLHILEAAVRNVTEQADDGSLIHARAHERARHHFHIVTDIAIRVEVHEIARLLLETRVAQHARQRQREHIERIRAVEIHIRKEGQLAQISERLHLLPVRLSGGKMCLIEPALRLRPLQLLFELRQLHGGDCLPVHLFNLWICQHIAVPLPCFPMKY